MADDLYPAIARVQVDRSSTPSRSSQASAAAITVRAPATSANLGPGFDCLGLALDLWNDVSATPGRRQADDQTNLILRAARRLYEQVAAPYPGFELHCTNRIPFGRGLGSSSSAIVCGLLLANGYLGNPLSASALVSLAATIEGHPDNVVPCLLGGVRVAAMREDGTVVQVGVPLGLTLRAVLFVPEQPVPTVHARGLLPRQVPMQDALFNIARVGLLVAALAAGQPDVLAEATRDRLHQPYRLPLFPAGGALIEAAMHAGALGAFTSGAGPSVLALCADAGPASSVSSAFAESAGRMAVPGATLDVSLTQTGAHIVD